MVEKNVPPQPKIKRHSASGLTSANMSDHSPGHTRPDHAPDNAEHLRGLIHDWLMYHSTHTVNTPRHPIGIMQRLLKQERQRPDYEKIYAALFSTASTTHQTPCAHRLPALIAQCQDADDGRTLTLLLTLYETARREASARRKPKHRLTRQHRHALPPTRWQKWLQPFDGMLQRPTRKRFRRWWLSRRHFGFTPQSPPVCRADNAVGRSDPRRSRPTKSYLNPEA